MSSQNSVSKILGQLTKWSLQEVQDNLNDILPVLINSLQCMNQKAVSLQAVQALLASCLPCIPVSNVDEKLLRHVLPTTEHLFTQTLEGIVVTLESGANISEAEALVNITSLIQVCVELLNCLELVLQYIESHGHIEVRTVPSIPKVILSVLLESFKHCKESEKLYGSLFQITGESLCSLFKKTHDVQTHFYVVMQNNLHFDCTYDEDANLLNEVLHIVADIGELVMRLGLKTMATLWKAYIFFIEHYVEHLRGILDIKVPLKFLSTSVVQNLTDVMAVDRIDAEHAARTFKVCCFQLKIIFKLCGHFTDYLCESYCDLLHLLVTLHRYSLPYLQFKSLSADIVNTIKNDHIFVVEALLLILIIEIDFVQEYFNNAKTFRGQHDKCLGFLLLSVSILKKLMDCNQGARKLWMTADRSSNLLCEVFETLDHCHEELCWEIYFPVMIQGGEPVRTTELYEYILTHISVFVVTASTYEFPLIERLLLQNILQSCEWRAMLAMDVWCIMARFGSTELCFQHLCILVDILKKFAPACYCPERVYLSTLLGRLVILLSNDRMNDLVKRLPPRHYPVIWRALGLKSFPDNSDVTRHLLALAVSSTTKFHTNFTTLQDYDDMMCSLVGATAALEVSDVIDDPPLDLTQNVVNLWHQMSPYINIQEGSHWINHFISIVCNITMHLVAYMDTAQLNQVLYKLKVIAMCASSSAKISITSVLKGLATKVIDNALEIFNFSSNMGSIFAILLVDKHILVYQATSEVFAYFAYVTRHEEIVKSAINCNRNLQNQMALYFKKLPEQITDCGNFINFEDFLKYQREVKFVHKCTEKKCRNVNNVDICVDQHVKKQKFEGGDAIMQVIQRINKDTRLIVDYCVHNTLPLNAKQELTNIIKHLNTFT